MSGPAAACLTYESTQWRGRRVPAVVKDRLGVEAESESRRPVRRATHTIKSFSGKYSSTSKSLHVGPLPLRVVCCAVAVLRQTFRDGSRPPQKFYVSDVSVEHLDTSVAVGVFLLTQILESNSRTDVSVHARDLGEKIRNLNEAVSPELCPNWL
ncbi:hypothetical protein BS17DRAFT_215952 [Gyrodon lividus]|nr:hypothetical protein BS17DRAFT_215952 [Gyrodon lividus]